MATNQIATLGVKVDPRGAITGAKKAKNAINTIGRAASGVKNKIMSVQGALIGLGAGAVLKSIITTASSVESLQIRLKFLTGSVEDASRAFDIMNAFAKRVPFTLEDIEAATPSLLTVADGVDELNELLEITGDIAAVSGLSFVDTGRQLQRAFASGIASAEMFKDGGISQMLGFEAGVRKTGKETKKIIFDMFGDGSAKMKGATDDLKTSFVGGISMMQDSWRELKLVIADAGIFEMTANAVKKITDLLKDEKAIENAKKFGTALVSVGSAMGNIAGVLMGLPPWVLEVGVIMAFLGGKKAKIVLAAITGLALGIDAVTDAVDNLTNSTKIAAKLDEKINTDTDAWLDLQEIIAHTTDELSKYNELRKDAKRGNQDTTLIDREIKFLSIDLRNANEASRVLNNQLDTNLSTLNEMKKVASAASQFIHIEDSLMASNKGQRSGRINKDSEAVKKLSNSYSFLSHKANLAKTAVMNMQDAYALQQISINATTDGLHGMLDVQEATTFSLIRNKTAVEHMGEAYDALQVNIEKARLKQEEFEMKLSTSIENSIMKMTQGLMTFKDVVKNIFATVAQEMVNYNIAKPLATGLSGILGDIFGGMVGGTGSVNIGADRFAKGGRPPVGKASIVGEKGAELFVPNTAGTIVPNNQLGGGQTINVTYAPQLSALDPKTAGAVIMENAPLVVGIVRQAFARNGQQAAL